MIWVIAFYFAVGLIAVPAGGGGTFFGGWLIKRLKLNRSRILFMCCFSQILCLIPILPGFLLNCDNLPFNGVNQEKLLSLTSRQEDDIHKFWIWYVSHFYLGTIGLNELWVRFVELFLTMNNSDIGLYKVINCSEFCNEVFIRYG